MEVKKITCRDRHYVEFPDLLFGKSPDNQFYYFNATHYIRAKGNPKVYTVEDFKAKFQFWIAAIRLAYDIEQKDTFIRDEKSGEILIDECLALLFVAYIDPEFGVYMLERMSEMLLKGITVSDTWLLQIYKQRFTTEELIPNLE